MRSSGRCPRPVRFLAKASRNPVEQEVTGCGRPDAEHDDPGVEDRGELGDAATEPHADLVDDL